MFRRLKASIPCVQATFYQLHYIRHFYAFAAGSIHLKKPSGGPKGLIGPPCHGAPWPPEAEEEFAVEGKNDPGFNGSGVGYYYKKACYKRDLCIGGILAGILLGGYVVFFSEKNGKGGNNE